MDAQFAETAIPPIYQALGVFSTDFRVPAPINVSQPFHVAEQFTGIPGRYVKIADSVKGFRGIIAGEYDDIPEQAFYMKGTTEEALEIRGKLQPQKLAA